MSDSSGRALRNRDLDGGAEVHAAELTIPLSPLPAEQVQEGEPAAGSVALGEFAGSEVGVWTVTETLRKVYLS